ncbi:energy-converting hydrogenase A subunit O [Methanofollis sp. W23]|uniref:hydrogenase large subunit n=1 Tax=Methanofollis sp. W23 TaxID=2817849 RepID=UPI001AEB3B6E|nr:nickel-dependent hydrogenase large subunit [Methanofollis sp. W23]MBP2145708.1 energy-converting hydrogenase A subunit O [Methanofollis sp. W23]
MKKTVDVAMPIGPVHPCWKEPVRIKCETKGEKVLGAEVEMGYMKKGIERIMQGRPWQEVMFLAERVCGICSIVHNMVFTETMEEISGIVPPERAAFLRVVANELDRMQSHLIANFSYCYTIEHETLAMYLLNERETVMDMIELLTGNRVNTAYMIPGGVRYDLREEDAETMRNNLDRLEKNLRRYTKMFDGGPLIALRSRGIGVLTKEEALEAHAVGPTGRASGIPADCRSNHPTYQKLGFEPIVRTEGDNYARIMVRFDELMQSIGLIRRALAMMPEGPVRGGGECKGGEARYSGEAPRGELTYFIRTDRYGRVEEIAIQTPSIMNIDACAHYMLTEVNSLADVTSTFISSDPCIACNER